MKIALTCDDAPTIQGDGGHLHADPERLDRVREALQHAGVPHCLAFVIGSVAGGAEEHLTRWLEAGYQLGNHTFQHLNAGAHEADAFLEDTRRCDELLEALGAFRDGVRYFRFPYLSRGKDPEQRAAIQRGLQELGYTTVPGTIDLYDHHYELRHARALAEGDQTAAERVGRRFVTVATTSLRHRAQIALRRLGRDPVHLPYFHVGHVSSCFLGQILSDIGGTGVDWRPVSEALDDPAYVEYEQDLAKTGLVTDHFLPGSLRAKITRRLIQQSQTRGWFHQHRDGPLWPYRC